MDALETEECNQIKVFSDLSTRLAAYKISDSIDHVNIMKLQFYCRLINNAYTYDILTQVKNEANDIFVNDSIVNSIIKILSSTTSDLKQLYVLACSKIKELKGKYEINIISEKANEIRTYL